VLLQENSILLLQNQYQHNQAKLGALDNGSWQLSEQYRTFRPHQLLPEGFRIDQTGRIRQFPDWCREAKKAQQQVHQMIALILSETNCQSILSNEVLVRVLVLLAS